MLPDALQRWAVNDSSGWKCCWCASFRFIVTSLRSLSNAGKCRFLKNIEISPCRWYKISLYNKRCLWHVPAVWWFRMCIVWLQRQQFLRAACHLSFSLSLFNVSHKTKANSLKKWSCCPWHSNFRNPQFLWLKADFNPHFHSPNVISAIHPAEMSLSETRVLSRYRSRPLRHSSHKTPRTVSQNDRTAYFFGLLT